MVCSSYGLAQDYQISVTRYSFEDGLSSRSIQSFHQDSRGFLWIATFYGLNRFDGEVFRNYYKETHDLLANNIAEIAEDQSGQLWLRYTSVSKQSASTIGLQRFDPLYEKVSTPASLYNIDPSIITRIKSTPNRQLYVATSKGILMEWLDDQLTPVVQLEDSTSIVDFIPDDMGFWIQTQNSIRYINKKSRELKRINQPQHLIATMLGIWDDQLHYTLSDLRQGKLKQFYYQCSIAENQLILETPQASIPNHNLLIRQPGSDFLWWAVKDSNDELLVTDESYKVLAKTRSRSAGTRAFNFCYDCSFFDRQGNLWNASENDLYKVSFKRSAFNKTLHDLRVFDNRTFGVRGMITLSDSLLWVNGLGPSFLTELAGGRIRQIDLERLIENTTDSKKPGFPKSKERLGIIQDKKGDIWISNQGGVLYRLNPISNSIKAYSYDAAVNHAFSSGDLENKPTMHWSLHQDQHEKIWLGHRKGLSFLDPSDSVLRPFQSYEGFTGLAKSVVLHIQQVGDLLWLGTTSGIYLFDPTNERVIDHLHVKGTVDKQIPHDIIAHFYHENDSTVWLASKGGGLIKWDAISHTYQQFTVAHGLSDNVIYAVYPDEYNNLWLSSNKGIMQFDKATYSVRVFLKEDGITHEEFNTIAHHQSRDGTIYFGGLDGVTIFHPMEFTDTLAGDEQIPIVTDLRIQQRNTGEFLDGIQSFNRSGSIRLNPGELGLTLRFSFLDFSTDQRLYSYKIEGYDQDWNYVTFPEIRINTLPYGTYKLLLRAQKSQGIWSEAKSIPLTFVTPIYWTWPFLTLALLAIALLVYSAFHWRVRLLRKRQKELEFIVAERTAQVNAHARELMTLDQAKNVFFANISHELRTPVSLVLGYLEKIQTDDGISPEVASDIKVAMRNGQNIAKLVDSILNLARLDAQKIKIDLQTVLLASFIRRVFINYELKARNAGLQYHLKLEVNESLQVSTDLNIIETILNNLLSNAIKYSRANDQIELEAYFDDNMIRIIVSDTGVGIPQQDLPNIFKRYYQAEKNSQLASGGLGIGLALSYELAQLMNGELEVHSEVNKGSTFTCKVPAKAVSSSARSATTPSKLSMVSNNREPSDDIHEETSSFPGILVVEDNEDMCKFISSLLSTKYSVHQAHDGFSALTVIERLTLPPHLIICDYMMPGMDGITFLGKVKANPRQRTIPFIMLTARSQQDDKLTALSLGVDEYLTKPFSQVELLARVDYLMEKQLNRPKIDLLSAGAYQSDDTDLSWLKKVEQEVSTNLTQSELNVSNLSEKFFLSERQFYRKVKSMTGLSPKEYIREVRLIRALQYLEQNSFNTVSEVALAVGFQTTDYFSRLFRKRFGKKPSEY